MKKLGLILVAMVLLSAFVWGQNIVYLTSVEWPPYTSQQLPEMGASVAVAKAAFSVMGYELRVDFYPWQRAVKLAKEDAKYSGYFPEYYAKEIEENFIFSTPMGHGPLGFVEKKGNPIAWNTMQDLTKYTIGVVQGYVNTEEFDAMVAEGKIKTDGANSDIINMKKVGAGRMDMAVIDQFVMDYYMKFESDLKDYKDKLQFNKKILEDKNLYICFKKGPKGENLAKIFSEGISKINVDRVMEDYFKKVLEK